MQDIQKSTRRFSRQFHEIGAGLETQAPSRKNPNGRKSPLKFSRKFYEIGASLKGKRSLASVGAQEGPFAVAFEALNRVGDSLLERSYDEQKKTAVETGTREGLEETEAALRENRMVQLRQDDTLSAQAFNKSLQSSYLARLDTSIDGLSKFHLAQNSNDSEKFTRGFDADARKLLETLPPEWQATVKMELVKRKGRALSNIDVAVMKSESQRADTELLGKMDESSGRWLEAIRQSYSLDESDPAYGQAVADMAENRGKFIGALDGLFGVPPETKRKALAVAEKKSRTEHVKGAFGRAYRAGHGDKFIAEFTKSGLDDDGFDPIERRAMAKTLEDANQHGKEQVILVQSQSIADDVTEKFDDEAEALAFVRKAYKGDLEAKAVAQVKGRFADIAKAAGANDESLWTQLEAAAAGGATSDKMGDLRSQGSTRAVRKAMGDFIDNAAERKNPDTDWAEYDRLVAMSGKDLIAENIYEKRNVLADAQFNEIKNRRNGFRDKAAEGLDLSEPGTLSQQISAATNEFKWTGNGHAEKRGRFSKKVRATVDAEQQRTSKDLNYAERQEIIERLSKSVFVDDWFSDSKLPAGVVDDASSGGNRVYVPMKEIDGTTVKNAKAALVKMGVDDADDHVEELVAAQRRNGLQGVTEWFRSMGVTGQKAMTDEEKRRSIEQQETSGVSR